MYNTVEEIIQAFGEENGYTMEKDLRQITLENTANLHHFFEAVKAAKKEGATTVEIDNKTIKILDELRFLNMGRYNLLTMLAKQFLGEIITHSNAILDTIEREDWHYPEQAVIKLDLLEAFEKVYENHKFFYRMQFEEPMAGEPEPEAEIK